MGEPVLLVDVLRFLKTWDYEIQSKTRPVGLGVIVAKTYKEENKDLIYMLLRDSRNLGWVDCDEDHDLFWFTEAGLYAVQKFIEEERQAAQKKV